MPNILICGIGGRMGRALLDAAREDADITVAAGVDKFADKCGNLDAPLYSAIDDVKENADVIVDFSRPEAVYDILPFAKRRGLAAVLCTTGYTAEHEKFIADYAADVAIFKSSNMSIGVNLMIELCRKAAAFLGDGFDVEIIEKHHNRKVDAPSGTALSIAHAINDEFDGRKQYVYGRSGSDAKRKPAEIGIHAVRGGTIVGKHDAMFIGKEEIVTISHEAQSSAVFAQGALKAAAYVCGKTSGLYGMKDMLDEASRG